MEIIINGKQAYLKKNTSFDFIFENRLFTGSDSYTLTITFPLKGCARNIAIFGHIHRADVIKSKVVFDCDIRDGAFLKSGSITITEISDVEVKTHFSNRSSSLQPNPSFKTDIATSMRMEAFGRPLFLPSGNNGLNISSSILVVGTKHYRWHGGIEVVPYDI